MRKHFRPLSTSDVVVALISQQSTPDGLEGLKEYLFQSTKSVLQPDRQAQQLVFLPPFAVQELSESQLMSYHIQRGNFTAANELNYQSLLSGVDGKMRKIIGNSQSSFEKSNEIMQDMILKLRQFCQFITIERKPLTSLNEYIKKKYLAIIRKIVRIRNMEKTLDVMKLWNQSKISEILSIRPQNITNYANISEVFNHFDQISQLLAQRKHQFSHFANLVTLVHDRKREIIEKIYQNALNCIVEYCNSDELKVRKDQYQYILAQKMLPETGESIFAEKQLGKLIEGNIYTIYQKALKKNGLDINIELARDNIFLTFYSDLLKDYQMYFSNWHKVTTFHIQNQSPLKEGFIQQRTVVFMKMLQKIEASLKYSNKVNTLPLPRLIHLFNIITEFINTGEEWMGKSKTQLPQILKEKCQQEVNNFFKVKNGDIKNTMLGSFNSEKGVSSAEIIKQKIAIREEITTLMTEYQTESVDLSKVSQLLNVSAHSEQQVARIDRQSVQSEMGLYLQRLNTKLGLKLFKTIMVYSLRQQYLPHINQLSLISQHFQYILMIIYKMCIPTFMKRQLQQQIYNEYSRTNKINTIRGALQRNQVDEETIAMINELRHGFLERSTYGILYDFIAANQSKYQGISLASYININLFYQQPDKYQSELSLLSETFAFLMSQLYILADYVNNLMSGPRFPKTDVNLDHQLTNLKNVIASLTLYYFTAYFQSSLKRFYAQVMPLFLGIRFEVKKLNEFKANLKDYKNRAMELYQTSFSIDRYSRQTCFFVMLTAKQREYFYKFITDLFSRIQKINDNGRHILRQEANQLGRLIGVEQTGQDNWYLTLTGYLELSQQRNEKAILEKIEKVVLQYPIQWWRSNVIWFYNDCSTKEKKDFLCKLGHVYLNRLISLPKI